MYLKWHNIIHLLSAIPFYYYQCIVPFEFYQLQYVNVMFCCEKDCSVIPNGI